MSDAAGGGSAGALMRAARERQGLHIAALAAAIKVPPAKLEALEAGRYDELTDATFVRALAQSVCRVLKIDAKPVLELLPGPRGGLLDRVDDSNWARFDEHARWRDAGGSRVWHQPVFWIVLLLLLAAAAFLLWPERAGLPQQWRAWFGLAAAAPQQTTAPHDAVAPRKPAAGARAAVPVATQVLVATPVANSEPPTGAAGTVASLDAAATPSAASAAAQNAAPALVRASEPSWVEARDARGTVVLSRTLQAGESVNLEGPLPLKLVIGNAQATEVLLRGQRVALGAPNRDKIVHVELK